MLGWIIVISCLVACFALAAANPGAAVAMAMGAFAGKLIAGALE